MNDETGASRPETSTPPDGPGSSSELLPDVYDDLRRLARARLSREPAGLTLGATALVHEAYLRLAGDGQERQWDRRGHFFAAAAIAMRRILVERARRYARIRHGGGQHRTSLDVDVAAFTPDLADVVAIDRAVDELERLDARKAQVVMLQYFAGFTVEETAAAMDLSPATIKSEWAFARAWLWLATARSRPAGAERVRFLPGSSTITVGYEDGAMEVVDLHYFHRFVAGNAAYQHGVLARRNGVALPRAGEVLEWSRRVLSGPAEAGPSD